jgi:catechol 2,3-dioxygenase-like lactoylglutathione lyase family enzyme
VPAMFAGVHALIYARDAERARAFFRDVLGFGHVDAGQGWLIFALPPAEVGIHPIMPDDAESHQLYFMCSDVKEAVAALEEKGVQCAPVQDAGFGLLTSFEIPGGGPMGLYQPKHPMAITAARAKQPAKRISRPKTASKTTRSTSGKRKRSGAVTAKSKSKHPAKKRVVAKRPSRGRKK